MGRQQPPSVRLTKAHGAAEAVSEEPNPSNVRATLGRTGRRNRADTLVWDDPVVLHLRGHRAIKTLERIALDPLIAGILELIRLLLRSASWTVEPGGTEERDQAFSDFVAENVKRLDPGWNSTIADAAEMILWGFQLFEVLFEEVEGGLIGWAGFMPLEPTTVQRWITDPENGRLRGVVQVAGDGQERIIPAWKLLHFRHRPSAGRPEGRSLARNAFLAWTDKQELRRILKVGLRRDLTGMAKLEGPSRLFAKGATPEDLAVKADAEALVRQVERDELEGIFIPHEDLEGHKAGSSGWRLSLIGSAGRRTVDLEKVWNLYRTEIAIAMLADVVLLGHGERGSFALGSAKTNTLTKAIGAWLGLLQEHMEKRTLPILRALNPVFANAATPTFSHGDIEDFPLEDLATYVKDLGDGGFIEPDEGIEEHLRARANLPAKIVGTSPEIT